MDINKKEIIKEIQDAWKIARLDHATYGRVAKDHKKTNYVYYIIVIGSILGVIGEQVFGQGWFQPTLKMSVGMGIVRIITTIIGIYFLSIIGEKLFGGKAKKEEVFRVLGYGTIVMWLGIIPQLGFIGGIWLIVITLSILKHLHKLSIGGIVGSIIVSLFGMGLVLMILNPIFEKFGLMPNYDSAFDKNTDSYFNMDGRGMNFDFRGEDGEGNVQLKDGKMLIEGEDGDKFEMNFNKYE